MVRHVVAGFRAQLLQRVRLACERLLSALTLVLLVRIWRHHLLLVLLVHGATRNSVKVTSHLVLSLLLLHVLLVLLLGDRHALEHFFHLLVPC
jgi:hypothetical protein